MTDAQCRRAALNLAAQLPPDDKARRQIVEYFNALQMFLQGLDMDRVIERMAAE